MSSIVKFQRSTDPFEHIPRFALQDKSLSLDALGALCRLLSLPGDWEWKCWYLEEKVLQIGRDKRKRIFNELIQAGYLKRSKNPHGENGGWQHTYHLFNSPQKIEISSDAKTVDAIDGNAKDVDKQNTYPENTDLYNTQPQQPEELEEKEVDAQKTGGGCSLVFDKAIDQSLHQKLTVLLQNVEPKLAQQMLDVVAAMGEKALFPLKLIKNFVENPTNFDPSPGLVIARKREREKADAEKRLEEAAKKAQLKNYDPAEKIAAMKAALKMQK